MAMQTPASADTPSPDEWRADLHANLIDLVLERIQFEIVVLKKHEFMPRTLYRYRAIDPEELDDSYALQELRNSHIWMASPKNFNDPYDSAFFLDTRTLVDAIFRNRLGDFKKSTGRDMRLTTDEIKAIQDSTNPFQTFVEITAPREADAPKASDHDYRAITEGLRAQVQDSLDPIIKQVHDNIRENLRIACFTSKWDSMSMWHHYANHHQGICFEYDVAALPNDFQFKRFLFPVIYGQKGLDLTTTWVECIERNLVARSFALVSALHKASEWAYEEEWRFILPDPAACPPNRQIPLRVNRVILGEKADEKVKKVILSECRMLGIAVDQCRIAAHKGNPTVQSLLVGA